MKSFSGGHTMSNTNDMTNAGGRKPTISDSLTKLVDKM